MHPQERRQVIQALRKAASSLLEYPKEALSASLDPSVLSPIVDSVIDTLSKNPKAKFPWRATALSAEEVMAEPDPLKRARLDAERSEDLRWREQKAADYAQLLQKLVNERLVSKAAVNKALHSGARDAGDPMDTSGERQREGLLAAFLVVKKALTKGKAARS